MSIFSTFVSTVSTGISNAVTLVIPGTNANRLFASECDHLTFDVVRVFNSRIDYFEKSRLRLQALQTELRKKDELNHALELSAIREFLTKESELRTLMNARFRSDKLISQAFTQTRSALLFADKVIK